MNRARFRDYVIFKDISEQKPKHVISRDAVIFLIERKLTASAAAACAEVRRCSEAVAGSLLSNALLGKFELAC